MTVKEFIKSLVKNNNYEPKIKEVITAKNKNHLREIVWQEIRKYGMNCDLNHIDASHITNIESIFSDSKFNGDISKWDVSKVKKMGMLFSGSWFNGDISNWNVSNVTDMISVFSDSKFNGDISRWNVSSVKNMGMLFSSSNFNGDISNWDVSNVENMFIMFSESKFTGDLSNWKPLKLKIEKKKDMFRGCSAPIPYWAKHEKIENMIKSIKYYCAFKIKSDALKGADIKVKNAIKISNLNKIKF